MPDAPSPPAAAPLPVVYCWSPTCEKCREASQIVRVAEQRFGDRIRVERLNIHELAALERMLELEAQYGVAESAPPKIFVGRQYLKDLDAISKRLDAAIAEELEHRRTSATATQPASQPAGEAPSAARTGLLRRFASFRLGAVAVAGLVDGINPCAFTTIVFLLSMLSYLGKSRHELAIVGVMFTAAVFATYFALGLGLFHAIKVFAVSQGIALGLTYAIAGLAIVLGLWSLVDGVRFVRLGEAPRGALGLPRSIKLRIHALMRTRLRTRHLAVGSFAVGCLVSLLESVCTGQVYLPTIMLVIQTTELRMHAIGYLLLYNVMFIVPLVVMILAAYWGVGSDRLGQLMRRHLGAVKFLMASLFIGLGVLLLATA